jgi:hypothetical protein
MGIDSQDSADFPGDRSAEYTPLPARGQVDPANVLLDAKSLAVGVSRSRIPSPRGVNDAAVLSSPVCAIADSGPANIAKMTPDLVPTTIRMMGNVVYLHAPTGKVLMEVGNLSLSELLTKRDLGAINAFGNEAGLSTLSHTNLFNNNNDSYLIPAIEAAPIIRTPESCASDHKDPSQVPTGKGRRGYKQMVRNQKVKIEPEQSYSPGEVAAALNVSYDTALRRMLKMKGVVDLGTPTRRYKRGKKKLRIRGKKLLAFLETKTVV